MTKLSLSDNPHPELIDHIERYSGKLGVLELISKKYQENPTPFDTIGIKVWPQYTPTIITPGDTLTKREFGEFMNKHWLSGGSKVLLRWSLPGDYSSLVDVVPTVESSLYPSYSRLSEDGNSNIMLFSSKWATEIKEIHDVVNENIHDLRERVKQKSRFILRYAELSWVPFDGEKASFGLIPKFKGSLTIVTEHPNHEWVLIQEWPFEKGSRNKSFSISQPGYICEESEKVKKLLEFLRDMWILDSTIAYSFELGSDGKGNTILFQIREICKKMLTKAESIELTKHHSDYIQTILTTIPEGLSKKFTFQNTIIPEAQINLESDEYPHFGQLIGLNVPLDSYHFNLNPNLHGIMTQNSEVPGVGTHENMRFIQYALQQKTGGIVVIWVDSGWYWSYASEIESDIRYNTGRYDIAHLTITRNEGIIDIKSTSH